MSNHSLITRLSVVPSVAIILGCFGADARSQESGVDFAREVRPVFAKHCFACHGPDKREGDLRLDSPDVLYKELESGEIPVVPKKLDASHLWARINSSDDDERMPPEGKPLSDNEKAAIRKWIESGAKWEEHWAFRQPTRPDPPSVKKADWVKNPIDAFILAGLERKGLHPTGPADPVALVRRVYYDLTGLPPTVAQVDAFVKDPSPKAYEALIDRLLKSPHYGEKWARHWMDVVRYAETNGYERDGRKENVWKYRDYLIRAFNEDKPYDRFIIEQLAGDELDDGTADSIVATGFYRLGLWDDEPVDREQAFYDGLDDVLRTTTDGFLGLTLGCARCHEHKIDPLPQAEYYRMLAFFRNIRHGNTQRSIPTDKVQQARDRFNKIKNEKLAKLREDISDFDKEVIASFTAEETKRAQDGQQRQQLIDKKRDSVLTDDALRRFRETRDRLKLVEQSQPPSLEKTLAVQENGDNPQETFVLVRGIAQAKSDKVEPGFPLILSTEKPKLPPKGKNGSTRRRLALANWIASPSNKMTSRVAVNRVWQHHFGRGIVRSANNFGQLGSAPTHPKLLDWLASEFVKQGWSMKELHKLIMMSNTYRMSSRAYPEGLKKDPANELFWRFNMRRMSAEEIRDSLLMASGTLNLKMFGPSIFPELPREVLHTASNPGRAWGKSSPEEASRRSIYIHVKRSLRPPMMENFDAPDTDTSCEARVTTTVPTQALSMLNGKFINDQAGLFARRLEKAHPGDIRKQAILAVRLTTGRVPPTKETDEDVKFIKALESEEKLSKEEALRHYCLMILNTNEFIYLD